MNAVSRQRVLQEDRWEESRNAERRGDIITALNIHRKIMSEEATSYPVMVRAGWLYYQLGLYEIALRYYELAYSISNEGRPLYRLMNCLAESGEADALANVAESIYGTGNPSIRYAAA
jgi:tetratricopeptide (TPR) repeat protein